MTSRVAELSVDEFRQIIRETMIEVLRELIDDEDDLEFKPEVAEQLRAYLRNGPKGGRTLEEVAKDLGIEL